MRLAFARAIEGDLEAGYRQAAKVADLRKERKCGLFAHGFAALCSRTGRTDEAITWLEFGVRQCGVKPWDFSADPDYANVGRAYPDRVARLVPKKK